MDQYTHLLHGVLKKRLGINGPVFLFFFFFCLSSSYSFSIVSFPRFPSSYYRKQYAKRYCHVLSICVGIVKLRDRHNCVFALCHPSCFFLHLRNIPIACALLPSSPS